MGRLFEYPGMISVGMAMMTRDERRRRGTRGQDSGRLLQTLPISVMMVGTDEAGDGGSLVLCSLCFVDKAG